MTNLKHWNLSSAREGLVSNVVSIFRAVVLRGATAHIYLKIVMEVLILFHCSHVLLFWKVLMFEHLPVFDRLPLLVSLIFASELLLDSCDLEGLLEVAARRGLAR